MCFATANRNKIVMGYELQIILNLIPDACRLLFAQINKDKIKCSYDLELVIKQIPPEERISLAKELQDRIKNGYDLHSILRELPDKSRLAFAIEQRDKIKTEYDLGLVISQLPPEGHFIFQNAFEGKSISQKDIDEVLWASSNLPEPQPVINTNGFNEPRPSPDKPRHNLESSLKLTQVPVSLETEGGVVTSVQPIRKCARTTHIQITEFKNCLLSLAIPPHCPTWPGNWGIQSSQTRSETS